MFNFMSETNFNLFFSSYECIIEKVLSKLFKNAFCLNQKYDKNIVLKLVFCLKQNLIFNRNNSRLYLLI
jgi:hypothetical protein